MRDVNLCKRKDAHQTQESTQYSHRKEYFLKVLRVPSRLTQGKVTLQFKDNKQLFSYAGKNLDLTKDKVRILGLMNISAKQFQGIINRDREIVKPSPLIIELFQVFKNV